jgi:hypothetical protein
MTGAQRGQVNSAAAEIYDAFFVPALFGQFPERVLDHAGVGGAAHWPVNRRLEVRRRHPGTMRCPEPALGSSGRMDGAASTMTRAFAMHGHRDW